MSERTFRQRTKNELMHLAGLIYPRGLEFIGVKLFGVEHFLEQFKNWIRVDTRTEAKKDAAAKQRNDARLAWAAILGIDPTLEDPEVYCHLGIQAVEHGIYKSVSLSRLLEDMEGNGLQIVADRCHYTVNDNKADTLFLRFDESRDNNEQLPINVIRMLDQCTCGDLAVYVNPSPVRTDDEDPYYTDPNGQGWQ